MQLTTIQGTSRVYKYKNIYLASQPSPLGLDELAKLAVHKVYNLRGDYEGDFSQEKDKLNELGIEYEQFSILEHGMLDKNNINKLNHALTDDKNYFIHCGTANRVAAWLIIYLVDYKKMSFESAVRAACENGLTNMNFIQLAKEYLEYMSQE